MEGEDKKGKIMWTVLPNTVATIHLCLSQLTKNQRNTNFSFLVTLVTFPVLNAYIRLVLTILDIITNISTEEHWLWTKRRATAQKPKSRCWWVSAGGYVQLKARLSREGTQVMRQEVEASADRPWVPWLISQNVEGFQSWHVLPLIMNQSLQLWKAAWPECLNKHP